MTQTQADYKDAMERKDFESANRLLEIAMHESAEASIKATGSPLGDTGICVENFSNGLTRVTKLVYDSNSKRAVMHSLIKRTGV